MSTMLVYEDFEHPGLPEPGTGGARAADYLAFTGHGRAMARMAEPGESAPHHAHHAASEPHAGLPRAVG